MKKKWSWTLLLLIALLLIPQVAFACYKQPPTAMDKILFWVQPLIAFATPAVMVHMLARNLFDSRLINSWRWFGSLVVVTLVAIPTALFIFLAIIDNLLTPFSYLGDREFFVTGFLWTLFLLGYPVLRVSEKQKILGRQEQTDRGTSS